MLWLLVQPVENGGYGMRWSDAIRLGPTQALFIMQTKEQAEAAATQRNRKLNGLDVQEHANLQRARMKELRKRYTGVETRQELDEKKPAKKR